ncbi:MAG: hypothetical protein LBP34_07650 [Flavobacteriaceae bacterium]|jgi:hypothetical protein|nr:hypothetical protein [Flavobacteriaceae bacterium]
MKIIGKIGLFFTAFIIVAHTFIPHQHRAQIETVLHECFFSDEEKDNSSNIFDTLGDIIKHVNLGEKQLENFRVSTYKYEFSPVTVLEIHEILYRINLRLISPERISHTYHYNLDYSSVENLLSCGLRAPPAYNIYSLLQL